LTKNGGNDKAIKANFMDYTKGVDDDDNNKLIKCFLFVRFWPTWHMKPISSHKGHTPEHAHTHRETHGPNQIQTQKAQKLIEVFKLEMKNYTLCPASPKKPQIVAGFFLG